MAFIEPLLEAAIGFIAGIASGLFGIGGGMVTIPLLRVVLDTPPLVAAATPLVAIVPTAISGGYTHHRAGNVDLRTALIVGVSGALTAVAAARLTSLAGGSVVMFALALVIAIAGINMLVTTVRRRHLAEDGTDDGVCDVGDTERVLSTGKAVAIGLVVGAASGFLGIGGGFIMVPMFVWLIGCSIKRAIGTSLAAIVLIATPAFITHALLGHIDWRLAVILAIGSAVGGVVGARLALGSREGTLRVWFAVLMLVAAFSLIAMEFGWF